MKAFIDNGVQIKGTPEEMVAFVREYIEQEQPQSPSEYHGAPRTSPESFDFNDNWKNYHKEELPELNPVTKTIKTPIPEGKRRNQRWTKEEDKFLRANWDKNIKTVARQLKRTYPSVLNRRFELKHGLKG